MKNSVSNLVKSEYEIDYIESSFFVSRLTFTDITTPNIPY
jgi:hypothetical protein